jgi:hypothetical protein
VARLAIIPVQDLLWPGSKGRGEHTGNDAWQLTVGASSGAHTPDAARHFGPDIRPGVSQVLSMHGPCPSCNNLSSDAPDGL